MKEVLIAIRLCEFIKRDVHYRTNDLYFYALHLLADKLDFGSAVDDINEAYYLGHKEELPPTDEEIFSAACERSAGVRQESNEGLLRRLYDVVTTGIYAVEEAKREPGLPGGAHAILDGVSQKLLTLKGLCWRSLDGKTTNGES